MTTQIGELPLTFQYELEKAKILRLNGNYDSAMKVLDSALNGRGRNIITDEHLLAGFLYEFGALLLERGDLERGYHLIHQSLGLYINLLGEEDTLLAQCYNKLGNYHFYRKEPGKALEYYIKALDLTEHRSQNSSELASYFQNIGIIHSEFNEYQKAEEYLLKSLVILQETSPPDLYALAKIYTNLGKFYFGISAYDKSQYYLDEAEALINSSFTTDHPLLIGIYWNKGTISSLLGDYRSSVGYLTEAKRLIEMHHTPNSPALPGLNMDIAYCYQNMGYEKEALQYYKTSLENADQFVRLKCYRNLAFYYLNVNQITKSLEYINLSIGLIRNSKYINSYENAISLMRFGQILLASDNPQAIDYLREALLIFLESFGNNHRDVALVLTLIGNYHQHFHDLDSALYYYHQSLISLNPSFNNTDILENPTPDELRIDLHSIRVLWEKAEALENKYLKTKDFRYLRSSLSAYERCIYVLEKFSAFYRAEESKMILSSDFNNIYKNAVRANLTACNESGNITFQYKAFEISEKSKAAILLTEMRDENARKLGLIPESIAASEKNIKSNLYLYQKTIRELEEDATADENRITYLRSALFKYEKQYDSLIRIIELRYPDYYRFKYEPSVVSISEIQRFLRRDEVMLHYTLAGNRLIMFSVSRDGFDVTETGVDSTMVSDIYSLRNNLQIARIADYSYKDYMHYQITANKLYKLLIGPVADKLNGKRLIIVPDGELAYLSFESMLKKVILSDTIMFRNLPYLIKDNPVSYTSSASIYAYTIKKRRPVIKSGVLAFAPTYSPTRSIPPELEKVLNEYPLVRRDLPGALLETENILKMMKGKQLIGKEATESNFKMLAGEYDILHFAMHAWINDVNPLSSTLSFYPLGDTIEDDFLQTYEIYSLDLRGHLAVLSACSTGDGLLHHGEGVISLARAFLFAGIPSIVMTLWDVEDLASGAIIPLFYSYLAAGYEKDIALREAKLYYLHLAKKEIEAHPAFWAGFVIHGNRDGFRQYNSVLLQRGVVIFGILVLFFIVIVLIRVHIFRNQKLEIHNH
ncbi:MAG: CHAT domain-containing protein [Bacteroidales bacterium]|nr:CHAT domain-containing protein [Bacteroidales bacterium]